MPTEAGKITEETPKRRIHLVTETMHRRPRLVAGGFILPITISHFFGREYIHSYNFYIDDLTRTANLLPKPAVLCPCQATA